jgi:hypothetical protein
MRVHVCGCQQSKAAGSRLNTPGRRTMGGTSGRACLKFPLGWSRSAGGKKRAGAASNARWSGARPCIAAWLNGRSGYGAGNGGPGCVPATTQAATDVEAAGSGSDGGGPAAGQH